MLMNSDDDEDSVSSSTSSSRTMVSSNIARATKRRERKLALKIKKACPPLDPTTRNAHLSAAAAVASTVAFEQAEAAKRPKKRPKFVVPMSLFEDEEELEMDLLSTNIDTTAPDERVEAFRRRHSVKIIEKFFIDHALVYRRAVRIIRRNFNRWKWTKYQKDLKSKEKFAVLIQKRARGMIVRHSDHYSLAQIFLKMPKFWRELAKSSPSLDGGKLQLDTAGVMNNAMKMINKAHQKLSKKELELQSLNQENLLENPLQKLKNLQIEHHQLDEMKQQTKDLLTHIDENIIEGRKLPPKLPIIIPQPFDKKPYVSLSDGRELNFFTTPSSVLSAEFIKKTTNTKNFELKSSSLKFLEGKQTSVVVPSQEKSSKLTASDLNSHLPVHIYSSKFWPITRAPEFKDTDVELYDSSINNFEFAQNRRDVLFCEHCSNKEYGQHHRLRMIQCHTCRKGFCIHCAFHSHFSRDKHAHKLEFIEPRVITYVPVTKSLVHHVDVAQGVMHDLKYVVRYLRSAAEIQRIAKEKQMLKDYEKQQEFLRIQFLQAQELYRDRNDKATKISLIYRRVKAKAIVTSKRHQVTLEKVLAKVEKFLGGVVKTQVLFRKFRSRMWLFRQGINFRGLFKYSTRDKKTGEVKLVKSKRVKGASTKSSAINQGKMIPKLELEATIQRDILRRALYQRMDIIGKIEEKYNEALQMIYANINFWLKQYEHIDQQLIKATKLRETYFEDHKKKQQEVILLNMSNTQRQKDENEKKVKCLFIRFELMSDRLENCRNMQWWIRQHLRLLYRKRSLLPVRLKDMIKQLVWIVQENNHLERIRFHCEERLRRLSAANASTQSVDKKVSSKMWSQKKKPVEEEEEARVISASDAELMKSPFKWIEEHLNYLSRQQVSLDAQQESIIKEELTKIEKDFYEVMSFDSLLEELIQSLLANNQIISERVALDIQLVTLVYGSNEGVQVNERLIALKLKQKHLTGKTIDNLKLALQEKHDDHDTRNMLSYAFPQDKPEMTVKEMASITAVLLTNFHSTRHINVEDFLQIYSLQPWLAVESVEDIRFEERMNIKDLKLGTLKEEMKGMRLRIKDAEDSCRDYEKRIREAKANIELFTDPIPDETEFMREKREAALDDAKTELFVAETEIETAKKTKEEVAVMHIPLQAHIDQVSGEVEEIRAQLKSRIKARQKSSKLFFDVEKTLCEDAILALSRKTTEVEDRIVLLQAMLNDCNKSKDAFGGKNVTAKTKNTKDIHWPSFMPQFPNLIEHIAAMHDNKPRLHCATTDFTFVTMLLTSMNLESQLDCLKDLQQCLKQEQQFLATYKNQREKYENFLQDYMAELQYQKKQRALELELKLRIERLVELRAIRLKALQELKKQQLEQEERERKMREDAIKNRKPFATRVAQGTKKAIRGAKDAYRDMKYASQVAMDEEEMRMARNIREKNKDGVGSRPECIRAIQFTIGQKTTDKHQEQNEYLKNKGLPHFVKLDRSIGSLIYMWIQSTFDNSRFITELAIAHKDPQSPYYKDFTGQRYWEFIDVDEDDSQGIPLRIWFRRNPKGRKGVKMLGITFTQEEEHRMIVDGFEKMEPPLQEFGLPESALWMLRIDKEKKTTTTHVNSLIAEVNNIRDMLSRKPNDRNLQQLLTRMNDKLKEAHQKEVENEVTNPLAVAIELMALNDEDIELWIECFERWDKERNGKLTIEHIFDVIDMPITPVAKEVFVSVDAIDDNGFIEFGDFVRAVGTYCFFGKEEILKFLYTYVDFARKNAMTFKQLQELTNQMNPYENLRSNRALKEIKMKDDDVISFQLFVKLNERLPGLFLPAFLLQNNLRQKTLGTDWWFVKLSKYRAVRNKLAQEGENTDDIVATEWQRFHDDEIRRERMARREDEIKCEPSEVRKTILKARQFLDEIG